MRLLYIGAFCCLISPAWADNGARCAGLFTDLSARATCVTILNMNSQEYSDDALRDKISQMVYGVSYAEMEARHAKQEAEVQEAAAAEQARALKHDQCQRLFVDSEELETCKTLRMLSMSQRSDDQMREEVAQRVAQLRKEKADQERVQQKAQRARTAAAAGRDAKLRQGNTGFEMLRWELGGFGTVMQVRFILQNNTASSQKDFVIRCDTYGESGTRLSAVQKTLYQSLAPKARRTFDLSLGFVNSQSARASCGVVKSAPG